MMGTEVHLKKTDIEAVMRTRTHDLGHKANDLTILPPPSKALECLDFFQVVRHDRVVSVGGSPEELQRSPSSPWNLPGSAFVSTFSQRPCFAILAEQV